MLIGYEWISDTDSQAVQEAQRQALLNAGVAASHIYQDAEITQEERPGLQACLSTLQAEDTLMVWQLDRLVSSRSHLLKILQDLWQRNIGLKVLAGQGVVLDTARLNLKLAIDIIAALSELEAQVLRKRTMKAQAEARARGQQIGPHRKMTVAMLRQAMTAMAESKLSMAAIANEIGVTRATLYNYLNGDGSPKPAGKKLLAEAEDKENP
ncbi:MAG: recombinase family protein [Leptolyngbya sp. SIO1E4]|nr:recombinase family protein [Leptolyngbya sp. SIO1E4]